jgi:hypothetical protein
MCGLCSTREKDEKCVKILVRKLKGREHLEDLYVVGSVSVKIDIKEIY